MKNFFRTCIIACLLACFVLTSAVAAVEDESIVVAFLNEEEELGSGVHTTVGELDEVIDSGLFSSMPEGMFVMASETQGLLALRPDKDGDSVWLWMVDHTDDQTPAQYLASVSLAIAEVCGVACSFAYGGDIVFYSPVFGSTYVDEEEGIYGDLEKFAERVIMIVVS